MLLILNSSLRYLRKLWLGATTQLAKQAKSDLAGWFIAPLRSPPSGPFATILAECERPHKI